MFYVLETTPIEDEDGEELAYFQLSLARPDDGDLPWYRGVAFKELFSAPIPLTVDLSDDIASVVADYLLEPIPLVSSQLREAIEAAGVPNVQWYPTIVRNATRWRQRTVYYAMNVVGMVAAADSNKTSFTRPLGVMGADEIDTFVVDESKCRGLDIFRLAEHVSTLVVTDRVREAIMLSGIQTLDLIPLEGWSS